MLNISTGKDQEMRCEIESLMVALIPPDVISSRYTSKHATCGMISATSSISFRK